MDKYKPSVDEIKELQRRSGQGMMDCKMALKYSKGDIDKALNSLEERNNYRLVTYRDEKGNIVPPPKL